MAKRIFVNLTDEQGNLFDRIDISEALVSRSAFAKASVWEDIISAIPRSAIDSIDTSDDE